MFLMTIKSGYVVCEIKNKKEEFHYEICMRCVWLGIDEENGYPEGGIAPGTKWEDIPDDFECPLCSVGKDQFSAAE